MSPLGSSGLPFKVNDLNSEFDDTIQPTSQREVLAVLRGLETHPIMSFRVLYTLRLLTHQFFRDQPTIAEQADDELAAIYTTGPTERVEGDLSPPDFPPDAFVLKDNRGSLKSVTFNRPKNEPEHVECL